MRGLGESDGSVRSFTTYLDEIPSGLSQTKITLICWISCHTLVYPDSTTGCVPLTWMAQGWLPCQVRIRIGAFAGSWIVAYYCPDPSFQMHSRAPCTHYRHSSHILPINTVCDTSLCQRLRSCSWHILAAARSELSCQANPPTMTHGE